MAGSNDEMQIEGDMTDEHNKGPPIAIGVWLGSALLAAGEVYLAMQGKVNKQQAEVAAY